MIITRTVDLQNKRLKAAHFTVAALLIVSHLISLFQGKLHKEKVTLRVNPALAINSFTFVHAETQDNQNTAFCNYIESGTRYHAYDMSWEHQESDCLSICFRGSSFPRCHTSRAVHLEDASISHASDVTLLSSKLHFMDSGDHRNRTVQVQVLPEVLDVEIKLSYTYEAAGNFHRDVRGSNKDATTIFIDGDGNPGVLTPTRADDEGMYIKMKDIWLAAKSLDQLRREAAASGTEWDNVRRLSGDEERLFQRLLTGERLSIQINCYTEKIDLPSKVRDTGAEPTQGSPVCLAELLSTVGSVVMKESAKRDGDVRMINVNRGVTLVGLPGHTGYTRFINFPVLILHLTSLVVLLSFPKKIFEIIAFYFLGSLSLLYRRVLHEKFNLDTHLMSYVYRLMNTSAAFRQLVDTHDIDRDAISEQKLQLSIHKLLPDMADYEIATLAHYFVHEVHRISGSTPVSGRHEDKVVTGIDFNVASTEKQVLNASCMANLFDAKRDRKFLERLFTPRHVWELEQMLDNNLTRKKMGRDQGSITTHGQSSTKHEVEVSLSSLSIIEKGGRSMSSIEDGGKKGKNSVADAEAAEISANAVLFGESAALRHIAVRKEDKDRSSEDRIVSRKIMMQGYNEDQEEKFAKDKNSEALHMVYGQHRTYLDIVRAKEDPVHQIPEIQIKMSKLQREIRELNLWKTNITTGLNELAYDGVDQDMSAYTRNTPEEEIMLSILHQCRSALKAAQDNYNLVFIQFVEARFAELEDRIEKRWSTLSFGEGLPRMPVLEQYVFDQKDAARKSGDLTSGDGTTGKDSTKEGLGSENTKGDLDNSSIQATLGRLDARIDVLQSEVHAAAAQSREKPLASHQSPENITELAERLLKLEGMVDSKYNSLDNQVWHVREEIGSYDWKSIQIENELVRISDDILAHINQVKSHVSKVSDDLNAHLAQTAIKIEGDNLVDEVE